MAVRHNDAVDSRQAWKRWLGQVIGLAFTLLVAVPAAAQSTQPDNSVTSLVVPLLLGAIVLACVAVLAYHNERSKDADNTKQMRGQPAQRRGHRLGTVSLKTPTRAVSGSMLALEREVSKGKRVPLAVMGTPEPKTCPTCLREYHSALSRCPFDQTKLATRSSLPRRRAKEDYLDTNRSLMRCQRCERAYDVGAEFCPFDGEQLEWVDDDDSQDNFEGETICPECGEQYDHHATFCSEDGARLVPAQASKRHSGYGSIPLKICPTCRSEYPISSTTCPKDGEDLLILVGRTTGGLPIYGSGPRERICPDCGTRYGRDQRFCAHDGADLMSLN